MQPLSITFVLAVLVEALIERFGTPIPSRLKPYAAAVVGMLLCLAYNADLLALLGLTSVVPFVGQFLTGLIISRGANYLNDLVTYLPRIGKSTTNTTVIAPVVDSQQIAEAVANEQRVRP